MSGEEEIIYNLFIDPEELKSSLEEVILSWSCRSFEIAICGLADLLSKIRTQRFQIIAFNHSIYTEYRVKSSPSAPELLSS